MNRLKEIKKIIRIVFLFGILGFFFTTCSIPENNSLDERLQKALIKGVKKYNIRGVSAAIVFDTDSLWVGTSGVSHDTISMKSDMLFSIGSITKNFVAVLTLKLVEQGILSLDDKLSVWLPKYKYIDSEITIRQLLNHTSGIYNIWGNDDLWEKFKADKTRIWTHEEVLEYIKEPPFEPGKSWGYSNTNYLLMGMIIEKATNSVLGAELRKQLWEPHNMQQYHLWLYDSIPKNQAHIFGDNLHFGSIETDITFQPRAAHESITFGSSGIVTTAIDLAKWSHTLFNGEVLSENSMYEMLDFLELNPQPNNSAYGLGVHLYTHKTDWKAKVYGHGGANPGSASYMLYLPEYQASVVIMVNAFPTSSIDFFAKELIKEIVRANN